MSPLAGQRTLAGLRIVVTRAVHQAEELAAPLRSLGAEIILLPTIGIAPPQDPEPLRRAAQNCQKFDWILFTSSNAVQAFLAELHDPVLCKAQIATVGAATRETVQRRGFTVSLTPEKYLAESLVEAFQSVDLQGRHLLIPSAAVTRDVVAPALRARGAEVTVVEAYRNIIPPESFQQAQLLFQSPYPDWITFTSSSSVENLIQMIGVASLHKIKIATIGPVTSETIRSHQLNVTTEAPVPSINSLVLAISEHLTISDVQ